MKLDPALLEQMRREEKRKSARSDAEMEEVAGGPSEAEEERPIPSEAEARRQELEHRMEAHTLRTREAMERDIRDSKEDIALRQETASTGVSRARKKLEISREELQRRGHDTEEDIDSRQETTRTNEPRTREETERDDIRHRVVPPGPQVKSRAWIRDRVTGERWVGWVGDRTLGRPERSMREAFIPEEEVMPQFVSAEHMSSSIMSNQTARSTSN